ncbi:hypothetical protein X896_753 [Burkholderia pseudomallei ABCPW 1]|nr:hypothetical protein X896_753 [Burkholderia pseudomallei ABCPW 1]
MLNPPQVIQVHHLDNHMEPKYFTHDHVLAAWVRTMRTLEKLRVIKTFFVLPVGYIPEGAKIEMR